ncbi:diguanylate cyclase [Legionella sp. MW5194]|uniref:diguanylate cyclase domain-containing protein n=1 Tax=Legionella sp. MW5194 TaxID=2662448 RepID=UPI00193E13D9|nr:diguanylate cyclase [Legionella sp. MW5194]QRN04780.1 diguanylate cyclase [Legionella sp. MW5194]
MTANGLRSKRYYFCYALAAAAYLIAVVIMVGWITRAPQFATFGAGSLVMRFNTALCIVLTSSAVFALALKKRLAMLLSLLSGLIGLFTLLEYASGWDLGLDYWFLIPQTAVDKGYPIRMGPNTAFCIVLLNAAILLYCLFKKTGTKLLQLVLVALVLCLSLAALFGYLLDIQLIYNWAGYPGMGAQSAFCFMLLSLSLAILFYYRHFKFYSKHGMVQTMTILVTGFLFFILLWQNFLDDAAEQLRRKIAADTRLIAKEIEVSLHDSFWATRRFFSRLNHHAFNDEAISEDAGNYLKDMPTLAAIVWGKETLYQHGSMDDLSKPHLLRLISLCQQGLKTQGMSITVVEHAASGAVPYLCFAHNQGRPGWMLYNLQRIVSGAVKRADSELTGVEIHYGPTVLFTQINEGSPAFINRWAYTELLQLDFLTEPLVFKLWPSPRYVAENRPWLPIITIFLGLALTTLLALVNLLRNKVATDNTQLKTSITDKSRRLLEVESRYQRIYDNSPDLYLFVDRTCRIMECNQTFMRTLGVVRKKSLLGQSVFEVLNIKNTMLEKNIMNRIAATGVINNLELDLVNQFDSTSRMMLKVSPFIGADNQTIGYLFSFRDISNIKALQEELASKKYSENLFQENKTIYDLILDETTDGWWDINLETKECILSSKLLRSLGYERDHYTPTLDFFRDNAFPDDFKLLESNLKKHIVSKGKYPLHQEVRYRHRNGKPVWILCRGQGIVDPDGRIRRVVGTHIDITTLKFTQEKLSLKNLELDLIYKTTRMILVTDTIQDAFKFCAATISQAIRFAVGLVYYVNNDTPYVESVWHQPMKGEAACSASLKSLEFSKKEGIVGQVFQERKALWLSSATANPFSLEQAHCSHFKFSGALAFPIIVANEIYAVFEFLSDENHTAPIEDLDMIDLLASQMSLAVERKMAYSQLQHLALHDELTKLPNRRACMEMLELAISRATRNKSEVGLMFLDLDDFKEVNDTHGHHLGDQLLVEVSQCFKQSIRAHDYLARLAGDEFLLIVTDFSSYSALSLLAKRLIESIPHPLVIDGIEVNVSVSIGIAVYPFAAKTAEALLQKADAALYKVKSEGKNSFYFSNPG